MRASTAAQQVEKAIGERREKLNEDAQKEQAAWRDLQQPLANAARQLTPDQIRAKERELQERITNAQKSFRDRNRIIQEAAQYRWPDRADADRRHPPGGREPRHEPGAAPGAGRAEHQRVRHHRPGDAADEQDHAVVSCRPTASPPIGRRPRPPGAAAGRARRRPQPRHRAAPPAAALAGDDRVHGRATRGSSPGPARIRLADGRGGGGRRRRATRLMLRVAPLQLAGPEHVSFLDNRRYADCWRRPGPGR